ncbi:MAG: magnesium/cobalt transporter CorA [Methanobacterium sp.]|nr:magnesium/cobalt transporter CorA [Methanobacterium sp.]
MDITNKKTGLPPGTLVYTGEEDVQTRITVVEYDDVNFSHKVVEKCPEFEKENSIKWIKVNGLADIDKLKDIGRCFKLHPLALEDILNINQRPKIEDYQDYLYVVLKLFNLNEDTINTKQVSFILEKNIVLSFQEDRDGIFEGMIKRIESSDSPLRLKGADYLLYSLIDIVIDSYYPVLEKVEDRIENIEEQLIERPEHDILNIIHRIKMDIVILRRSIWPTRDILNNFGSYNYDLIDRSTDYYIRDVYDHAIQAFDLLESFRDRISDMLDIYLSSTSNKLNEIVRVLTVISTIFVPLTFIVGLYGMNFKEMPELQYPYSYPLVLLIMLLIAVSMLIFFRRKRWI